MESKLNVEALKEYSKAFTDKILDSFFKENDMATGEDILTLTGVRQVNVFIVFQLLENWNREIKKLKSPYFDFKNKEVKKALKNFANTLSRHIRVDRENLTPLATKAVEDTLFLFLSPYDFYCSYISNWEKSRIKIKELKTLAKYVKINHNLMRSFISRLEGEDVKDVFKDDALRILNEVFEETSQIPEDIEPFVSEFSLVLPLDIDLIYGDKPVEKEKGTTLNEDISENEESPTLNDQLAKNEDRPTLADVHEKKPIESIKSNLTINQKFMFVNQLFDGNVDDFNKVVDFLDNCSNQSEAMDFINSNYLKKSSWKKDSSEVKEFIEVIAKKYA